MAKNKSIMKPKQIKSETPSFPKRVIGGVSGSSDDCYLKWCFYNIDKDGCFAFDCSREGINHLEVLKKIIEYGGRKWKDIRKDTHDQSNKTKHHFLEYDDLSDDAKGRISAKRLEDFTDVIYSMSLCNRLRIIGLRKGDVFEAIWLDPNHDFCPSKR